METIYSVKISKIRSKRCQNVTNAAYKLKTISLTGTPHNHKFFRKLLECVRDIVILLIKNKGNFFNKENCFVANRAGYIVFMPNFILFFFILITEFITFFFLSEKGKHIQSCIEKPYLRWSVLWK